MVKRQMRNNELAEGLYEFGGYNFLEVKRLQEKEQGEKEFFLCLTGGNVFLRCPVFLGLFLPFSAKSFFSPCPV